MEATTATLTLGGYRGALYDAQDYVNVTYNYRWRYKRTAPSEGDCSSFVTSSSVDLANLDPGASYTYKVYGIHYHDYVTTPDCTAGHELASATFLTRPVQVTGVTVTPGAASLNVGWTAGADNVTGYRVQWKSGVEEWSTARETTATTNAAALTGLTDGVAYTVRVAATDAGGTGVWSAEATGTPSASATTLTASAVRATTATLTLANHDGERWYHKPTVPGGGECSPAVSATTAYLTTLTAGTNHTFTAYSDVDCTAGNALASVPFLTRPGRVTGLTAAARPGSLALGWTSVTGAASYKVQWKSGTQDLGAHREATVAGTTHTIPSLTDGAAHVVRVAAANATGDGAWSAHATATPAPVSLTASAVRPTTATLTLASHGGPWYYKYTVPGGDTSCTAVAGATADLAGLDAGTRYTFKAYGDRDCATELAAAAPFTTPLAPPARVTGVTVAVVGSSLEASWTAVTGADSYTVQWRSGAQPWEHGGAREATVGSGVAYVIPSLTNGTPYAIRVRAVDVAGVAGDWSAEATGTPAAVTLTASEVGVDRLNLTIANYQRDWNYARADRGSCGNVNPFRATVHVLGGGNPLFLSYLAPGTRYTFKAYSDASCTRELTTNETDADFLTLPAQVTGVTVTPGETRLAVSWTAGSGALDGYKVQWKSGSEEYDTSDGSPRQKKVTSGTSTTITGLTDGAAYTVRVIGYNATGDGAASAEASATPRATLTASAVEAGTATLTISSHPGSWYYRYTVPGGDTSCTEVAGAATADLAGLDAGTSYTFKAYADAGCATEATGDATDAELLTKPGQVTGLTVTPGPASLSSSWTAPGGTVDGYKVQWKSDNESWDDTTRQSTVTGGATTATITDLTDGAAYTVRVTAYNATGDGAPSDEASATPRVALTASAVQADTATLTIASHTGDWYYRYTVPSGDTSCTAVSGAVTADLTGLDTGTSYTFKAYGDANCTGEITSDAADADFLTKPGRVEGLTVTSADASLAVSWTAVTGAARYRVQWRSGDQSFDAVRQRTVEGGAVTSAVITGLAADTTYTVRVTANNATGDGAASAVASGSPTATVPAQPTDLTSSEGDAAVTLSWTAGSDGGVAVTGWEVSARVGGGGYGAWTGVPNAGAGTRRHTVTKLANGVVHRFKVRAVNGVGAGAASAESPAATPAAFCGRTPAVRDAIVAAAPGKTTCGAVTATDLAGITGRLDLKGKGIVSLRSGDFAGLGGVTRLDLSGNALTDLPAGVFDPLTALTSLNLAGNALTDLPAGVFDRLTGLTTLSLLNNALASLPGGVFDRLTALTTLDLGTNRLADLPAGVFDGATALATLRLDANRLATLSPGVFDRLVSLKTLHAQGNPLICLPFVPTSVTTYRFTGAASGYAACGAGLTASASSVSVGAGASETYTLVLAASPNRFADSGAVTVTYGSTGAATATFSPSSLTFGPGNWSTPRTVTVTGGTAGSGSISHGSSGGGYTVAEFVSLAVTTASLAASAVTDTRATLTLTGHAGTWYLSTITSGGSPSCFDMSGFTTFHLSTLQPGTRYTFKAYSDATCDTEIASESIDTRGLAASAATATGMKLTLADHSGSWYHKHATGTCSATAVTGPTASVTDLTAGTSYTFSAYGDGSCTAANRLATAAAHATLPPAPGKPTASVTGQGSGAVRLGAVLGGGAAPVVRWEYTKQAGDGGYDAAWTRIGDSASKLLVHTVTGLADGTAYRFKVRAVNASGAGAESAASDAVTPRAETLTASAVQAATATLTLAGHTGTWYWKRTVPSGNDTCTAAPGAAAPLSNLPAGTSHTYKAYSDVACTAAAELASETFLTKPGQVTGVTVTAGHASLNVDWTAGAGEVTGYRVQWKSGDETWSHGPGDDRDDQRQGADRSRQRRRLRRPGGGGQRHRGRGLVGEGGRHGLGERDDPGRERDPGHHRHPDHRQPHRRLVLQVHRAERRHELHRGERRHHGESGGARRGHEPHLQGVRRRRLHDDGACERPVPHTAGAGDGGDGGGAAPVARRRLDGGDRRVRLHGAVEVGGGAAVRQRPRGDGDRRHGHDAHHSLPDRRCRVHRPRAGGQRDRRRRLVRGRGRRPGGGDPDGERGAGRNRDPDHRKPTPATGTTGTPCRAATRAVPRRAARRRT